MDTIEHSRMDSILRKTGLDRFCDVFNREKITPDIVCKMSLYDMHSVGVTERTEIMRLRTECISHGSTKPLLSANKFGGAPTYEIPKENLEILIKIGFKISEVSHLLGVSESTVYRRMRLYGLSKLEFTDIGDEKLAMVVQQTLQEFPKCGEKMLTEILRQKNVTVQRYRLRDILHQHDEIGVAQRRLGRLHRRIYHVQCPNDMWHVDTNHKLIRWGFIISGAIDGFSRLVTALHCLDNNKADTLLNVFIKATERFGIPRCVRTDMGMENVRIAEYMHEKRGHTGIKVGKSTHNQRIERLWRDVFDGVLHHYYTIFTFMEDNNILDVLNSTHLFALHYVYKHKINEKLDVWREAWSSHRLRTVGSSPLRLWASRVVTEGLDTLDIVHTPGDMPTLPSVQTTVFQADQPQISETCINRLLRECPMDWTCANFGINIYLNALGILRDGT